MEYTADTFVTHSQKSVATRYPTVLKGAFYYVYTDEKGGYHMAKEDEASLKARIRFYQDFISKSKYPVYSKRVGLTDGSLQNNEVLSQVLGLPSEMTVTKKEGRTVPLTAQEILDSISFEDGLFPGYSYIDQLNDQILLTDHDSVVGCINYLIEHGIFLQNPERVLGSMPNEENYYPFYVEEDLIPASLLQEKETADKLIMDFVDDPFTITKDVYLSLYKPLDNMTLTQKAALAFSGERLDDYSENDPHVPLILALRNYFFALAKDLMNEFYRKYYHIRGLFGFTVLDHDFEGLGFQNRFLYQGIHQEMYALSYRQFSWNEKTKQTEEKFVPQDYTFDSDRKKSIATAFHAVKAFFKRKPEFGYVPSVFLRLMGLPYPALEKVKYFDFEEGDSDSFLALLPFKKNIAYSHYGLMLTLIDNSGNQYSYRNWQSDLPFFLRHHEAKGVFFSDLYIFSEEPDNNYLFYQEKPDPILDPLFQGNVSVFHEAIEKRESSSFSFGNSSLTTKFSNFLIHFEKDGVLVPVKKLFDYLRQGYSSDEAYDALMQEDKNLNPSLLADLLQIGAEYLLAAPAKSACDALFRAPQSRIVDLLQEGEVFYDPTLPLPYVHKGRRFIGYSKTLDSPMYFDSKDKDAIRKMVELYGLFDCENPSSTYPIALSIFGRELSYDVPFGISGGYLEFMGLPKGREEELYDPVFEKDISLLYREDHQELLRKDESLMRMKVFAEGIRRGLLLTQKTGSAFIFPLPYSLPQTYQYYLSDDYLRYYLACCALSSHEDLTNSRAVNAPYRKLSEMGKVSFRKYFRDPLFGKAPQEYDDPVFTDNYAKIVQSFADSFLHAVYGSIVQEGEDLPHHFVGYYYDKKKQCYVAPGTIFTAYSKSKDLRAFTLPEKDFPLLLQALEVCKREYASIKSPALRARLIVSGLGLPDIFDVRMVNYLLEDQDNTGEEIRDLLPFGDVGEQEESKFTITASFALKSGTFSYLYSSTRVYHLALASGFYMSPDAALMMEDFLTPSDLIKDLDKTMNQLDDSVAAVVSQEPKEEIKEVLLPNEVTYSYYVDNFIKAYSQMTNLLPNVLFLTREALEYVYSLDPKFIVHSVNLLQGNCGTEAYYAYCEKMLSSFSLISLARGINGKSTASTKEFYTDTLADLLALFVLYQEQEALRKLTKRMLKEEK